MKFISEPGYIYDLIYIFVYRFNKQYCLANQINLNKSEEDINFLNSVMYEYSTISDDLLLFFHIKDHGKCFFSEYYFEKKQDKLISDYNFTYILDQLSDDEVIIKNIFQYYFPNIDYTKNISDISKFINESQYNDIIKLQLYSFFINPTTTIQQLKQALVLVNNSLLKYYEKNYKTLIDFQNSINFDELSESLKQIGNHKLNIDEYKQIYITSCLISKNCIKYFYFDNYMFVLLGYDYKEIIKYILNKNEPIKLNEVANVLSEKNRIDILDFILDKGEIAIRDLENELNVSGTNAYYHITMMVKANMLIARNQGKQVLYSMNYDFFDSVVNSIKKYSNRDRK